MLVNWASREYGGLQATMLETARNHGIDALSVFASHQPKWEDGTLAKAVFLRQVMSFPQPRNIVWVDADAEILERPVVFDELDSATHDIAFTTFSGNGPVEFLTGTLWIANNDAARAFLDEWIRIQEDPGEELEMIHNLREQACFRKALENSPDLRVFDLPFSYTAIDNHWDRQSAAGGKPPSGNPHILHKQASRQMRRKFR